MIEPLELAFLLEYRAEFPANNKEAGNGKTVPDQTRSLACAFSKGGCAYERRIYVRLPKIHVHKNHPIGNDEFVFGRWEMALFIEQLGSWRIFISGT